MKYKCNKCGTEFEAKMTPQCPKCGERSDITPVYTHRIGV